MYHKKGAYEYLQKHETHHLKQSMQFNNILIKHFFTLKTIINSKNKQHETNYFLFIPSNQLNKYIRL